MKKFLIVVLLLFGMGFSNVYLAQSGGRKRERRNQRSFARGGDRKGAFSRLFKKSRPAWKARNTPTDRSRYGDNSKLFKRFHTKGKQYNAMVQSKRNAARTKKRIRGSKTFSGRKYRR